MKGSPEWDDRWLEVLSQTYSLDKDLVKRLGEEFRSLTDETLEAFVVRRHRECQNQGMANDEIYVRLQAEVAEGRFRPEPLTIRQVRRLIYG